MGSSIGRLPESRLRLNRFELNILLGWPQKERAKPQTIYLDIELKGSSLFKACKTDALEDTVCYDILAVAIKSYVSGKEFKLIEHLTWELFAFVKQRIPKKMKLKLMITKPEAPVEGLLGGASFELEDL
ncbi:MAG: hypothetical protein A4S09_08000 [Proteobacteria bacterium SG_bin7]|nr:MAG: hypothetical protein A4S09_08000 [Proteobacteria bacterium SG_bin7]